MQVAQHSSQIGNYCKFDHKSPLELWKCKFFVWADKRYCNKYLSLIKVLAMLASCGSCFLLSWSGNQKVLPWGGDSACNQAAGRSLSFGLNPPLSPSALPHLSFVFPVKTLFVWESSSFVGAKYWLPNGAHRSPTPPCFVYSSFFVSCCPIGWLTGEGFVRGSLTSDLGDQNTKHVFLPPTSFRWPPTWMSTYHTGSIIINSQPLVCWVIIWTSIGSITLKSLTHQLVTKWKKWKWG